MITNDSFRFSSVGMSLLFSLFTLFSFLVALVFGKRIQRLFRLHLDINFFFLEFFSFRMGNGSFRFSLFSLGFDLVFFEIRLIFLVLCSDLCYSKQLSRIYFICYLVACTRLFDPSKCLFFYFPFYFFFHVGWPRFFPVIF